MSASSTYLTLRPDRCNQCGKCVAVCPKDAVRVGESYILVAWEVCDRCCACVEACDRNAIRREGTSPRSIAAGAVTLSDVSKVVVGSRAEAKALRKAAGQVAKQTGKPAAAPAAVPVAAVKSEPRFTATRPQRTTTSAPAPAPARPAAAPTRPAAQTGQPTLGLGAVEWTLVDVAAVLATLLFTIVAKNAVLAIPAIGLMPAAGRAGARAAVLAAYYAIQLGVLAFLAARHGSALSPAFGLRAPEPGSKAASSADQKPSVVGSALLVVPLLFGVEVVAIAYGLGAQAVGWRQPLAMSTDVASVFGVGGLGLVLSVVLVAIVAPVAEELAFRGVVLPALGDRYGMWPAIGISAVLFAAYHVNPWLFLPMLVFGLALGWLTWSRRSLWPAIAMHILYNGLAVAAAFWVPK